jgi:hypothetical protein
MAGDQPQLAVDSERNSTHMSAAERVAFAASRHGVHVNNIDRGSR